MVVWFASRSLLLLVFERPGLDLGIAPFGQSCMTTQGMLHARLFSKAYASPRNLQFRKGALEIREGVGVSVLLV